jgi:exosome complex exonuclease RRP6
LTLRRDLYRLGEIFADPSKVKVLHGCDRDVLWLQRDFGLYIVNCFDTFQAAKVLQFSTLSLAHLVKFYCGVTLNKKYQLADWRERPLSEEMLHYAKADTHYLLYIYDSLRKELFKRLGSDGVESVLSASKKVCMARYEKDVFDPMGYRGLLANSGASKSLPNIHDLSPMQESALAKLWDWRDRHARDEDESCQFIMSNAELLRIGMKIPRYEKDVLSCSPLTEYVRSRLSHIVEMMLSISAVQPTRILDASSRQLANKTNAKVSSSTRVLSKQDAQAISERAKRAIFTINPPTKIKSEEVSAHSPVSPQMSVDEVSICISIL